MKIKVISLLAIVASSFSASLNKVNSLNAVGSSSNTDTSAVEAVTYALANAMKMDDIYVENSKDYKSPTIVPKISPHQQLGNTGQIETVEEVYIKNIITIGSRRIKLL